MVMEDPGVVGLSGGGAVVARSAEVEAGEAVTRGRGPRDGAKSAPSGARMDFSD